MKVLANSQNKIFITSSNKAIQSAEKLGISISNLVGDVVSGTLFKPTEMIVPDFSGVTDIENDGLKWAFYGEKNVYNTVTFPDLTAVSGSYALAYAFQLNKTVTSFSFPELVTITGSNAFYNFATSCVCTSISFPKLATISAGQVFYSAFSSNPNITSVEFPALTTITGDYVFQMGIYNCSNLLSISFPELTTINGNNVFASAFSNNSKITSISLPKLSTANGNSVFSSTFSSSSMLETITFPSLSSITGTTTFSSAFHSCAKISSISFPALTTSSFGSNVNQFNGMFNTSSGSTSLAITMHFPSNLSSTISGLTGYPNFGATAGRLTLAFDLPATS